MSCPLVGTHPGWLWGRSAVTQSRSGHQTGPVLRGGVPERVGRRAAGGTVGRLPLPASEPWCGRPPGHVIALRAGRHRSRNFRGAPVVPRLSPGRHGEAKMQRTLLPLVGPGNQRSDHPRGLKGPPQVREGWGGEGSEPDLKQGLGLPGAGVTPAELLSIDYSAHNRSPSLAVSPGVCRF